MPRLPRSMTCLNTYIPRVEAWQVSNRIRIGVIPSNPLLDVESYLRGWLPKGEYHCGAPMPVSGVSWRQGDKSISTRYAAARKSLLGRNAYSCLLSLWVSALTVRQNCRTLSSYVPGVPFGDLFRYPMASCHQV